MDVDPNIVFHSGDPKDPELHAQSREILRLLMGLFRLLAWTVGCTHSDIFENSGRVSDWSRGGLITDQKWFSRTCERCGLTERDEFLKLASRSDRSIRKL